MTMHCPNCDSIDIGKIGTTQYYCWNCFLEFSMGKGQVRLYEVQEDGSLSNFDGEAPYIEEESDGDRQTAETLAGVTPLFRDDQTQDRRQQQRLGA